MSIMTEEDGAVQLLLFVTGLCGLADVGWATEGDGCGRVPDDDAGIAAAAAAGAAVDGGGTAAAAAAVDDDDGDDAGWGGGIASLCLHTAMREEGKKALVSHMVMTCIKSVEAKASKADYLLQIGGGGRRGGH